MLANTTRRLLLGTAAVALGLGWSVGANAADLQWSPNGVTPGGGGTGTWNTTTPLWFNGATFQTWNNAALDNAVFAGTTSNGSKRELFRCRIGNQQVQHAIVNLHVGATTSEDSNRD